MKRNHESNRKPQFELSCDEDAYCYLKVHLPAGYRVQAEPSTAYYPEWHFHYRAFRGETMVAERSGDSHTLEEAVLMQLS